MRITFPKSEYIKGIEWLGGRISYPDPAVRGDSYPMTWADDDRIHTSCGDPLWGDTWDGMDSEVFDGGPGDYKISKTNHMNAFRGAGGDGPKPTGMICVDGGLYLAIQNVRGIQVAPQSPKSQHGSDSTILFSYNKGDFWAPAFANIGEPMFPGHKFGGPSFINFGKNNENARDNYVYAVSGDQWDNGSNMRLGRVPKDKILNRAEWEFVCAFDIKGQPAWSKDLKESIPVLSMHRKLGVPETVYMHKIKRYLTFTWSLKKDFSGDGGSELWIFESPEPWGPFSLVHHEEYWESKEFNPYCPRLPLKWVEDDGVTCWLQFSGSWSQNGQDKGYYRSNIRKFKLLMKGDAK